MKLDKLPITVIIAVKNESVNLNRCLTALSPAKRVVVIDSKSIDGTQEIAADSGADVVQFEYHGGYPKKRQWALENVDINTPWVFMIDADEVIPDELWCEIADALRSKSDASAYLITKGFHFLGKKFKHGGFSFPAVLLFKYGCGRVERIFEDESTGMDMEVHERVVIDGKIRKLNTQLIHEDFKGLEAYISRHNKYSTWEAKLRHLFLLSGEYGQDTIKSNLFGNSQERRRAIKYWIIKMPFEHWLWFCYHYIFKLGFLEGRTGLIACRLRSDYISQVNAKCYELKTAIIKK